MTYNGWYVIKQTKSNKSSSFFSKCFFHTVCIYMAIVKKNSHFILVERADFLMVINLSMLVYALLAYVDIAFSRKDIVTEGYELVY